MTFSDAIMEMKIGKFAHPKSVSEGYYFISVITEESAIDKTQEYALNFYHQNGNKNRISTIPFTQILEDWHVFR